MFSAWALVESGKARHMVRRRALSACRPRLRQLIAAGLVILGVNGLPRADAVVMTDNFSDGNDTANPVWHHLDGAVGSTGQSWTVTNGQYHLVDPTTMTVGSTFPGLETVGFVGSYVDPQFTDARVTADIVDFVPPSPTSSYVGVALRLNGNNGLPSNESGIQLHGYTYHYEGPAADGAGEMVLAILHSNGLKDISLGGSQQVTLDSSKDYRFMLEAVGNVLHGKVLELNGAGQVVATVAETLRDLDTDPPNPDNYDYDPNTPDAPFVPYTSGYSGVFGVGFFIGSDADFTIDNFRTESLAGDFDKNFTVNGADLTKWKGDFGLNAGSNADGDSDSDGADFLLWQQNLGAPAAAVSASAAVPEPGTLGLGFAAVMTLLATRRVRTAT
jgi:hypothetical protein